MNNPVVFTLVADQDCKTCRGQALVCKDGFQGLCGCVVAVESCITVQTKRLSRCLVLSCREEIPFHVGDDYHKIFTCPCGARYAGSKFLSRDWHLLSL